jgi:hypothetical protein
MRASTRAASKISLVPADVDGTQLTAEKGLTSRARTAMKALRAAEIDFAITSGRPPRGKMLSKLRDWRRLCDSRSLDPSIEVDGGRSCENAALAAVASANPIVAGLATFDPDDYAAAITRIRNGTLHKMAVAQ